VTISLTLALLLLPAVAIAESATPTPTATGAGTLVHVDVPSLPGPPDPGVEVWLVRYEIEPGAAIPASPDWGAGLVFVERGPVIFSEQRAVQVIGRDGRSRSAGSSGDSPFDLTLEAGETLVTGTGTATGIRNDGAGAASVLFFSVFSPLEEESASGAAATPTDTLPGVTPILLAAARGQLPEGPGSLAIERITLPAGERVSAAASAGIEVGVVEEGAVQLGLMIGDVWVWEDAISPVPGRGTAGPKMIAPGLTWILRAGDGYGIGAGAVVGRDVIEDRGVTILRAVVEPAGVATPVA
jgi:quercetin dioxygenase-like cupin family protein